MDYLFFANTPAHVHLYRHAVRTLQQRGHDVLVLGRDYGCTASLLSYYALPYTIYGSCGTTKWSLFRQLPHHYRAIASEVRAFDPDLIFGMGGYAAHAGALTRTPVVLVLDSETTTLDHTISLPFARAVLTPAAFAADLGAKHYVFSGFKESAYLHPNRFEADSSIRTELGVESDEPFVVLRLNAFGSHHDVGEGGFGPAKRRSLIESLADDATVFVSDEGGELSLSALPARTFDLHPARLHDVLAEASLLVADTQTMVTEAALLGTPAIRSNSFVGPDDMGNFLELEARDLVYNLRRVEQVEQVATELLQSERVQSVWTQRRDAFVEEMVDLTALLVSVATSDTPLRQLDGVTPRSAEANAIPA